MTDELLRISPNKIYKVNYWTFTILADKVGGWARVLDKDRYMTGVQVLGHDMHLSSMHSPSTATSEGGCTGYMSMLNEFERITIVTDSQGKIFYTMVVSEVEADIIAPNLMYTVNRWTFRYDFTGKLFTVANSLNDCIRSGQRVEQYTRVYKSLSEWKSNTTYSFIDRKGVTTWLLYESKNGHYSGRIREVLTHEPSQYYPHLEER